MLIIFLTFKPKRLLQLRYNHAHVTNAAFWAETKSRRI